MNKNLTPETAWPKIKHYCAYSERCHYDVREKLFGMGLVKKDVEILLSRLIEEDRLNEERFAIYFAGGHFRQKKWGKAKIVYALRQRRVSEQNIKRGLKEIVADDYLASLQKIAGKKWESLEGERYISRQAKTTAYLLQKGYEGPLVQQAVSILKSSIRK